MTYQENSPFHQDGKNGRKKQIGLEYLFDEAWLIHLFTAPKFVFVVTYVSKNAFKNKPFQGESERDEARLERTLRVLDNPNADATTQMNSNMGFQKYGPYLSFATQMKNMLDRDNSIKQAIGFEQRDIYGHYRSSNSNAVDPYEIDPVTLNRFKYTVTIGSYRYREVYKMI